MNIGFTGYYQMNNYGDDLFAEISMLAADRFWGTHKARLIAARKAGAKSILGVPADFYSGLGATGKASRFYALMVDSLFLDQLVLSGGSVFHSRSSRALELLCDSSKFRAIGLSAIGVSIGPFAKVEDEKRCRDRLRRFQYISVRDKKSFDIASSFNLQSVLNYGADLAFLYPELRGLAPRGDTATGVVGFSPCNLAKPGLAKRYCDLFIDWISKVRSSRDVTVCTLNLNTHPVLGDELWCSYTDKELKNRGIPTRSCSYAQIGIGGVWELVKSFDAYVTVRLHGAVTACAVGTPFSLFEYDRKCTDFLDEVGYPRLLRAEAAPPPLDALATLFETTRASARRSADRARSNFMGAPWK